MKTRYQMKVGNLVQWVLNCPGFPTRQGVITHTFRYVDGPCAGDIASHRVQWLNKSGEIRSNTFRPRDLTVLA